MKESIRRLVLGPKRRPVAVPLQKDVEHFLQNHGKTILRDGNRVTLVDGDARDVDWARLLETDLADLLAPLVHTNPKHKDEA